jgi:replicative DNA helicase
MEASGNGAIEMPGGGDSPGPLLQPHNLEAEESTLGAMMVSEAAIDPVMGEARLKAEDFYRGRHGTIYAAVHELYERNEPVDALTVAELLRSQGKLEEVGGQDAINTLAATTPVPGNAGHYAQIVKQNAMLRRLLSAAQQIQQSVHGREGDPQDLVEQAEVLLFKVARAEQAGDFNKLEAILGAELDKLDKLASGEAQMTGTPSGFKKLDEITGGFQPGNLIVLAARPAMGKSSLVCNIAENVAWKVKLPVAFFSLEMSETELAHRFIASRARIPSDRLRKGNVQKDWNKVLKACNELAEAPLYIDDSSDLSMLDLRAKCRRLSSQVGGLGLVIVDYIQLMRSDDPRAGRVEQVGQMSRGLKILARELSVPVIGISQLSRAPEQRPDKVPILSDLRESGCLTAESRVHLPDTGGWTTIGELAELEDPSGIRVMALNEDAMKLEPRALTNAFCTGTKPVFKLRTKLGRTIRATGNHKFRTFEGWRRLDELAVGDALALPRSLAATGRPSTMTGPELALLGRLIGDGCTLPKHAIQYTTNELRLAIDVAELATAVFGDRVKPRVVRERNWWQVYLPSSSPLGRGKRNPVAEWLDGMGAFGLRSHEKRVPAPVFEQSIGGIARFLRHLWATDGCVWLSTGTGARRIYYASSSQRLALDVQSLLLRLGVNARIFRASEKKRGQWHVDVSGADETGRFLELVGAIGESKSDAARSIIHQLQSGVVGNTNRDVIPKAAWATVVKPAMATAGVTGREMQEAIGSAYSGTSLYRSNLGRERARRVADAVRSPELAKLAESDIYWDPVVSIAADGAEEVFDLTVDGLHNFVANDIVVHNSIEQDADIVSFIYRDEYYNKESERPGEADLVIAKHRNGPIGTVPLAFQDQFPKFVNLASPQYGGVEDAHGEAA